MCRTGKFSTTINIHSNRRARLRVLPAHYVLAPLARRPPHLVMRGSQASLLNVLCSEYGVKFANNAKKTKEKRGTAFGEGNPATFHEMVITVWPLGRPVTRRHMYALVCWPSLGRHCQASNNVLWHVMTRLLGRPVAWHCIRVFSCRPSLGHD